MTVNLQASPEAPAKEPAAACPEPPRRRRTGGVRGSTWWFVLPALAFYLFVVVVQTGRGAAYAFTDWDGVSASFDWIGWENFSRILDDEEARASITQTVLLAVGFTVGSNGVGLLLALALNTRVKSRNVLRTLFFAPMALTTVIVAYLWQFLYRPDGAINQALDGVGLGGLGQNWLGDPDVVIWAIAAMMIWQGCGGAMVVFLARLQGIPQDLLEAAAVDGASGFRRFWYIVRPMLTPALVINLVISIIAGLKVFDQVWATTGGGPGFASETLSTVLFKKAFQFGEFGYGAALGLVLSAVVGVIAVVWYVLLSRQEKNR